MPYYPPSEHTAECVRCSAPLTGHQERYCGAACRQAEYRVRQRDGIRPRQRYHVAKAAHVNAVCARCGEPAGWTGRGRRRKWCSGRCKVANFRAAAQAQEHASDPL